MEAVEQHAFLIHSRPFKDNQRIVDLLTENNGKVSAVVYIGKTLKTNKKGLLQPFLPLKILLKGRGQLKNLSRIESSQKSYPLTGDSVFCGFYLNELIIRLLGEHVECNLLFNQYKKSLQALSEKQPVEQTLRYFELVLLDELGQSFDFIPVFDCESPYFYYVLEEGFVPVLEKKSLPVYSKAHLESIAQQSLDDKNVLRTYKLLMRQVISNLLNGKPLNSRKLFTR